MENSLAIESFSYSWLKNRKFSFDGVNEPSRTSLDVSDEATSEETKHKMVTSKRFLQEAQNFNFDIGISKSPAALVHADEIFSDGHILPMYGDQSNKEAFNTSISVPSTPISSISFRTACPADRVHCHFLRKWRKSSKRILQKYLGFLRPLCKKVGYSRRSRRVDDIDRKVWEVRSWNNNSPQASPPQSRTHSVGDWCDVKRKSTKTADTDMGFQKAKSWNNTPLASPPRSPSYSTGDWSIDSSIYEAILHCKRSFEK